MDFPAVITVCTVIEKPRPFVNSVMERNNGHKIVFCGFDSSLGNAKCAILEYARCPLCQANPAQDAKTRFIDGRSHADRNPRNGTPDARGFDSTGGFA